jgi:putative transcriptional regulator
MQLLRNLGESTRLLILLETSVRHHAVQRTLAESLGMTVQGVSEYLRSMEGDGLLEVAGGEYRPTVEGIRVLHVRFRDLRDFVDRASKELSIIEVTAAIAGNRIEAGEDVGLFMEGGDLAAYAGRASPSRGRAVRAAEKGDDVAVAQLQGIVTLAPGRISLLRMPPAADGGSGAVDLAKARRALRRAGAGVVGVLDPPAKALAGKLRVRADIRFAAIPAAIEAAERGLDVALLVPEDRVAAVVTAIEGANERLSEKIAYETVSLA